MKKILAADIGGTSSRFAFFTFHGGTSLRHEASQWLKTTEAESFPHLLEQLRESGFPLAPEEADIAALAVAGPVEAGTRSAPPNIAWEIDLAASAGATGLVRAELINDFVAQAFATRSPIAAAAEEVLPGRAKKEGAVAVIGAGTGLGHATLVRAAAGRYLAVPSEKGHAAFPMISPREQEFQDFLTAELGEPYARGDTVLSGRGFAFLHRFLTGEELTPEEVTARFTATTETLLWAARFYGRACRDYALTTLALGGVYIAGGLAARTPLLVKHEAFAEEFRLSPTMGSLLEEMPVFLMRDQESGLWGAAQYGLQCL